MKRLTYFLIAFVTVLTLSATIQAQTLIDQWGQTTQGRYWPIQNDASTPAGNGSIMGTVPINGAGQASLRGGFGQGMEIKTDEAIIVSGELELVGTLGGESSYNPLRFAISYNADDTLMYALTDSAYWVRGPGYGYIWCPRTGAGTVANGAWGSGTVGVLNNGNWHSTNSNGGPALATILQAPRNAQMIPGTYEWAISVQQVNDTTNEIRWYMIEENNGYWFGGTVTGSAVTDTLTGVSFNVNTGDWTEVNVIAAQVGYGAPITVPEAPWEAYYVDQWGQTTQGRYWPILNNASTLVGDGTIAGAVPINGAGQASLRGGFGQELLIKTDEAIIVSGELELVGTLGGESSYNPLRFAISYNADDTLMYALTDSAYWVRGPGYGYIWCPRTGAGTVANGAWGSGTVGVLNNGNWHSTNSNGGPALATILQAPRNAQMIPGTYEWAISVHQVNDTTNEIRWYLIEEDSKYWFGGIVTGPAVTNKLTGVSFNVNTGDWTEVNVIAAQVDYGVPITIPEAPFEPYFVDQWGQTTQGRYWPIRNDASTLVGDATISGDGTPLNGAGWATLRGGFGQNLQIKTDEALIVRGELEFVGSVGAEDSYTPLRYAITYHADDTLQYALTDSAYWVRGPGSGYLFQPRTGAGTVSNGTWGSGTVGILNNGNWNSSNSNGGPALATILQEPRNAEIIPGTYSWAISVQQVGDTTNEVRWYLLEENKQYFYGGIVQGNAVTNQLNGICFGINTGDWTEFNILAAEVDYGAPIDIPKIFEIVIDGEKDEFYNTLVDPDDGYLQIQAGHGNDNGYPRDNSDLSTKVWAAWDEEWFYLYQEVMDDTITGGTTSNVWETDNLELKFDPQPTDSVTNSIWDTRLTGPGVSPGDSLNNITDPANKQFARKLIPGGFATELAIKWTAIVSGTGAETITPAVGNVFGLAINQHDNDGAGRQASIMWAAVMLDHVWDTPKYLGRVYFLDDHKLEFDPTNNMTGVENDLPYDGTPVGVEVAKPEIPAEFALSQNYPNPFNPSTTIEFALPKESNVSLIVYDALGRVVKELANGSYTAGYYTYNFNASDLASGIYFYALRAGDFVSVKKLMLLK